MALNQQFAMRFYNSCAGVYSTATQQMAVSVFCDDLKTCSWSKLMAGYSNQSPFSIQYEYSNVSTTSSGLTPIKLASYDCDQAIPTFQNQSCSCIDCEVACKYPPASPDAVPINLFGIYFMYIISPLGFLILVVLLTIKSRREQQKLHDYDFNAASENSASIELIRIESPQSNQCLNRLFERWALICATHPIKTIAISLIAVCVMSSGLIRFQVTSDPVELWSSPNSQSRIQKQYFDQAFGPFYRLQQVVIKNLNNSQQTFEYAGQNYTGVFNLQFLRQVFELKENITKLVAKTENGTQIRLEDICYSPLNNGYCVIQSPMAYFRDNITNVNLNYMDTLVPCIKNPVMNTTCFGQYGGPTFPYVAFGGFDGDNYNSSSSIIITLLVNNHVNRPDNLPAMAWEKEFLRFVGRFADSAPPQYRVSYYSERSIEDELQRQSWSDVWTVLLSYSLMFVYVSVSLGQFVCIDRIFIDSKIGLGLAGVVIVICSVLSSLGVLSVFGLKGTLIVIEVIPFLVLAIGVDNIFILVQAFQRDEWRLDESVAGKVARVYGQVAPSLLLAFIAEITCFFLGAFSSMPCIRTFALNAGLALVIAFALQMNAFTALLALDTRRQIAGRVDLLLCASASSQNSRQERETLFVGESPLTRPGLLQRFFEHLYAPFVMRNPVRLSVIIVFLGCTFASLCVVHKIDIGLDQKLSMPIDSYMHQYFEDQLDELRVGPPVYFMLRGPFNYSNVNDRKYVCSKIDCQPLSLVNYISLEQKQSNRSYIAQYANNWLDQYEDWVSNSNCFRVDPLNKTYCPPSFPNRKRRCKNAEDVGIISGDTKRIEPAYFERYLRNFIAANPDVTCPFGGQAAYGSSLQFENKSSNRLIGSAFMTYYTPLKDSSDFTGALKSARQICAYFESFLRSSLNMSETKDISLLSYSIFHVYYEQFLDMQSNALLSMSISLVAIFICSLVLFRFRLRIALLLTGVIVCVVINMLGLMYVWNISLNAVSLVNMVITVGIAVEFCSHVTYDFVHSSLDSSYNRVDRAQHALAYMGSSVLSGITFTKFIGIVVLAFAHSQIFQVFYFRMYLLIVFLGALHGLLLLPSLLSIFG